MFDTDGCVYNKYGNYAQIEFKFGCIETTSSVHKAVSKLKFNPTKIQKQFNSSTGKFRWRFYLSRQKEIDLFFQAIKPKNQKHQLRYKKIRCNIRYEGPEIRHRIARASQVQIARGTDGRMARGTAAPAFGSRVIRSSIRTL